MSFPVFVLIVTLLSLSLVVGGSAVSVDRGGVVMIHRCAVALVNWALLLMLHFLSLLDFVGDGSAGLEWQLVGAVAIGESANANVGWIGVELDGADCAGTGIGDGVVVASPIGNGAAAVAGSAVCVASVVVTGLLLGWKIRGCVNGWVVLNLVMVDLLTTSMSCLLYFSGSGCRLFVLALTTLLAIPMMFSLDAVSFPSQWTACLLSR